MGTLKTAGNNEVDSIKKDILSAGFAVI